MNVGYVNVARVVEQGPREEAFHKYVQNHQVNLNTSIGKIVLAVEQGDVGYCAKANFIGFTDGTYAVLQAEYERGDRSHNDELTLSSKERHTPSDDFLVKIGMFDTVDDLKGFNNHERAHREFQEACERQQEQERSERLAAKSSREQLNNKNNALEQFKKDILTVDTAYVLCQALGRRKAVKFLEASGWVNADLVDQSESGKKYFHIIGVVPEVQTGVYYTGTI